MIFLDTHVVVWLFAGLIRKISTEARHLIEKNDLQISPVVMLEMMFLYEIGRIREKPPVIYTFLKEKIGIQQSNRAFQDVVESSLTQTWTRDPIDRLIVATAALENKILLTADTIILDQYDGAKW